MTEVLLDLIVLPLWPLFFLAAAWAIAIYALAQADAISEVVETLTRPGNIEPREHKKIAARR